MDEIGVLDQPDLAGFFTGICSDRWVGVEESIQDCCGLPEIPYTPSRYNLEGVAPLRFEHCRKQKITPPLSRILKSPLSYLITEKDPNKKYYFIMEKQYFQKKNEIFEKIKFFENEF